MIPLLRGFTVIVSAIIGAGIGGTSCAHYLRELFGKDVQMDMYEGGGVGGRLATVNIEGRQYESGGSIIHPANAYMLNFTNMLGRFFHGII